MAGRQRVFVVTVAADADALQRLRGDLGRDPLVLAAPTPDAVRVVQALGCEPVPETLLAPVRFPDVDRGHRVDALVRGHALRDRFRDVVVVTDAATATLLLRVLAPGQLATGGAVTLVGLARGERPVVVRRAAGVGVVLGLAGGAAESLVPVLVMLGGASVVGAGMLALPAVRHLGRELLLAVALAFAVVLLVVASSARFPGSW